MLSNISGAGSSANLSANTPKEVITPERAAADNSADTGTISSARLETAKQLEKAITKGEHIPISEQQLIKAIERAIKAVQGQSTQLEFSIHDQTRRILVKVMNKDTGEIIREIPPEKSMDLLVKLWEMAGILVDERR